MNINERIKKLRKELDLTLEKFGERIGIKKSTMSSIETGRNNVTDQMFKSICREFNVNEEWLLTGKGEMLKKDNLFSLDEFLKKRNATSLEIEFMKIYFTLEENVRKKIISDFKKAILKEEIISQASKNKNNELSTTNEMNLKPAYKMTDEEINEEVEAYRQQLILEKKQKEELSASQKDELA